MKISLEEATSLLLSEGVVAIPTETVYGLAAKYDAHAACEQIFALKKRPPANPLILHIASYADLLFFTSSPPESLQKLSDAFWPGPLTCVLPVDTQKVPALIRSGLPTQAFRIPSHPLTLQLIQKVGPLVAPSANLSGKPSSVSPEHVEQDFGCHFPVLDGGMCQNGVESTILLFQEGRWHLGRLGAIPQEAFAPILGYTPAALHTEMPLCPGHYFRHYAPNARLHLNQSISCHKAIVGFSDRIYPGAPSFFSLGSSHSPQEALFNLYTVLRKLDEEGISDAHVDIHVPQEGLWLTFLERIQKAAAG